MNNYSIQNMNNNFTFSYDDTFDFYIGSGCTINSGNLVDINIVYDNHYNHYKLTFYDGVTIIEYLSNDDFYKLKAIIRNNRLKNFIENI